MEQESGKLDQDFMSMLEMGLQVSYEKLATRKAEEGGTLIFCIDGNIAEVPASDLLKDIKKES